MDATVLAQEYMALQDLLDEKRKEIGRLQCERDDADQKRRELQEEIGKTLGSLTAKRVFGLADGRVLIATRIQTPRKYKKGTPPPPTKYRTDIEICEVED